MIQDLEFLVAQYHDDQEFQAIIMLLNRCILYPTDGLWGIVNGLSLRQLDKVSANELLLTVQHLHSIGMHCDDGVCAQ